VVLGFIPPDQKCANSCFPWLLELSPHSSKGACEIFSPLCLAIWCRWKLLNDRLLGRKGGLKGGCELSVSGIYLRFNALQKKEQPIINCSD